ncbi:MAG: hypothetical protein HY820_31530 [Acidobacteria bacterium]|nr:hypothetical protein [Acidobacteriota bacterium]
MTQSLVAYSYLQLLDLLTTIAFLLHGVEEGNPVVRFALRNFSNPFAALLAVKLVALALGLYCWRVDRRVLLSRMNLLFAILVAWNLLALIVKTLAHGTVT